MRDERSDLSLFSSFSPSSPSPSSSSSSSSNLQFSDFYDLTYIAQGGYGCVISGKRKIKPLYSSGNNEEIDKSGSSGGEMIEEEIAMKFFGYSCPQGATAAPNLGWIHREINTLSRLNREIKGIVELKGSFLDSHQGFLTDRKDIKDREGKKVFLVKNATYHKTRYPVICMERLSGLEFFDYVKKIREERFEMKEKKMKFDPSTAVYAFTEKDVSCIFRQLIVILQDMHIKARTIAIDLKLENLNFVSSVTEDLNFKFIDFGLCEEMPANSDVILSKEEKGTRVYFAPETINFTFEKFIDPVDGIRKCR